MRARLVLTVLLLSALVALAAGERAARAEEPDESRARLEVRLTALEWRVACLEDLARRQAALLASAGPPQPPLPPGPEQPAPPAPEGAALLPRPLPASLARAWADDFEALEALLAGVRGRYVGGEAGLAWLFEEIPPDSPLTTQLGLRPGDRLLGINGAPIGASTLELRRQHEALRHARRFELAVVREGRRLGLSYYVP